LRSMRCVRCVGWKPRLNQLVKSLLSCDISFRLLHEVTTMI